MKRKDMHTETCAHCGKAFEQSDYSALCNIIMKHKPACDYECNVALGQVDEAQIRWNEQMRRNVEEAKKRSNKS